MSKRDFKKKSKDLKFLLFISGFNYQSCCSFLLPPFPSPQPPCLDATTLQRTAAFRITVGLLPLILMLYDVKDGQKHLETLAIWIVQLKTGCSRATAPALALWITCTPQFSWRHFANGYFCRHFSIQLLLYGSFMQFPKQAHIWFMQRDTTSVLASIMSQKFIWGCLRQIFLVN